MDNGNGGEFQAEVQFDGAVEDVKEEPKPDSPRTIWARENYQMLLQKEEQEKTAKEAIMVKAKDYLNAFNKERSERIAKTKKMNREDEAKAQELKERPQGSVWEQILQTIDFNQGVQQKDVARFRSLLFQAKEADLPMKE